MTVILLVPSAVTELGLTLNVELLVLAGPGIKLTVAVLPTVDPSIVPLIVAVPTVVTEVKVAV